MIVSVKIVNERMELMMSCELIRLTTDITNAISEKENNFFFWLRSENLKINNNPKILMK